MFFFGEKFSKTDKQKIGGNFNYVFGKKYLFCLIYFKTDNFKLIFKLYGNHMWKAFIFKNIYLSFVW